MYAPLGFMMADVVRLIHSNDPRGAYLAVKNLEKHYGDFYYLDALYCRTGNDLRKAIIYKGVSPVDDNLYMVDLKAMLNSCQVPDDCEPVVRRVGDGCAAIV